MVGFRWGCDIPHVDRQQIRVLRSPLCGKPIQRAFRVELLIRNHSPDSNNQIVQSLRCRPEISDANHSVVEVRMKYRGQHPALWSPARIAEGKVHLEQMYTPFEDFSVARHVQTANVVGKTINLRGHSGNPRNLDQWPSCGGGTSAFDGPEAICGLVVMAWSMSTRQESTPVFFQRAMLFT
jgi:hypothetical protein